ncbi:unnamed protein product [Paramecium sonneborni]|uniref:Uncharacterized protein n=1 Tax=Paramecium sonneborni TaxID=65129 RepID=A0A8S1PZE8_9CILI|nr:unnamed protein product [Paramecium sonneborni]
MNMNMNVLMRIAIIIIIVYGTDVVVVVDQCTCDKLLSQMDCKSKKGCDWSSRGCQKQDSGDGSIEGYCGLISDGNSCAKTKGCAYVESKCQIFGGCTAYKGVNNVECQSISKFCNSDGDAFCIEPEKECTSKASNGGSGICVWDNSCREQKCNEADISLNTDDKCNNFIKGCITKGKGCTDKLGLCQSYSGDIDSCEGLKGSDGYCKGVEEKDKCKVKECLDADSTITTDEDCNKYQIGCITNGYGCTKSPLGSCTTQTGDDIICSKKIGQDGQCKGVVDGKTCSVVECKDAPNTYSTNLDCEKYKSGCITTGKGCTHLLGTCTSYKGTITTCQGYIGIEGKCKGISDVEESSCSNKDCKDADLTFDTDEQCNEYQLGCKTTGKGCISTLKDCSSYTGNQTICNGYIGIDGKCTGGTTNGSCYPKKCSDAPTTFITNQECSDYQTKCVAIPTGGCIQAGECKTLIIQNQCEGKSTCQWKPQCVSNETCSDLKTEILCKTVTLQDKNTCWWVNSTCVPRICNQAPETFDTDSKCETFLNGCLTNKKGCVDSTAKCTSYKGNKTACQSFTIKCTNSDDATDTSTCKDPVCSENNDATTNDACQSLHRNCLTNGKGCISISENCSSYPGTSIEICGKFKGNNQQNPCWWKLGNSCLDKVCTDADTSYISDDGCDKFLKGCVTTGAGCIGKSEECSAYKGLTQEGCLKLSKGCSRREKCTVEITCDKIDKPTSQESCDAILANRCIFVKDKCYSIGNCNTYPGSSVEDCKNLVDLNQEKCYWTIGGLCTNRACSQIQNPSDLTVCVSHISQCAKSKDGTKCIDVDTDNCTDIGIPNPANEEQCQKYHPKCHFGIIGGIEKCTIAKRCSQYGPSKDASCSTLIALGVCKQNLNDNDSCLDDTCNSFANDQTLCKSKSAYSVSAGLPIPCFYFSDNGTAKCEIKSCGSAISHLGSVSSFEDCNKYYDNCVYSKESDGKCVDGGCTAIMGSQDDCLQLKGKYSNGSKNEFRLCYKHNNAGISNCVDRICSQKQGNTDVICQEWLPTCKTDGQNCVDITTACTIMKGTNDSCKQLTGIVFGSKCQGNTSIQGDCVAKRCQDNGTAKTDEECNKFLSGCITTGNGCIERTTTCAKQWGNQSLCKLLTGNDKPCWSLSTTNKEPCIDRICSHNREAQTNDDKIQIAIVNDMQNHLKFKFFQIIYQLCKHKNKQSKELSFIFNVIKNLSYKVEYQKQQDFYLQKIFLYRLK